MTNVVTLPVRKRTAWTTIRYLCDGRRLATSSGFGAYGSWNWILDTLAHEHNIDEDLIGCVEDDGGDDIVTIAGEPTYRIEYWCS